MQTLHRVHLLRKDGKIIGEWSSGASATLLINSIGGQIGTEEILKHFLKSDVSIVIEEVPVGKIFDISVTDDFGLRKAMNERGKA